MSNQVYRNNLELYVNVEADIAALEIEVASNTADIATNTTDINTNTTDINTNTTDITTNTGRLNVLNYSTLTTVTVWSNAGSPTTAWGSGYQVTAHLTRIGNTVHMNIPQNFHLGSADPIILGNTAQVPVGYRPSVVAEGFSRGFDNGVGVFSLISVDALGMIRVYRSSNTTFNWSGIGNQGFYEINMTWRI